MHTNSGNVTRVRLSFTMSVGIILSVAAGFAILGLVDSASRSIGWIVFSSCIALMLYPAVNILHKYMPRGIAVLLLVIFSIGLIVIPVYSVVDDVNSQTNKLEKTLPQRARQLEAEGRFSESFREFQLEVKTRSAIRYVPDLLQGGNSQERIKANANRAIAFLAGGVLMIFFLLYGHKLVAGALSIVQDEDQREKIKGFLSRAYARCTLFGWTQILLSISVGIFTYVVCRTAGIPAAGLLATWVALWNIVPVFGVVLGTLPIVLLAGSQSIKLAWILLAVFITYEICESFMRHRLLGPKAIRLDSIITILIVFGGIEFYGLGGALAGLVIGSFIHALASEIASTNPE